VKKFIQGQKWSKWGENGTNVLPMFYHSKMGGKTNIPKST
jgi:hypothetical protein